MVMRRLFPYGRIYARLPAEDLQALYPGSVVRRIIPAIRWYVRLFGYPDIAGHLRFPLVHRLARPKAGDLLLDAGCGTGIYSLSFAARDGIRATGIDLRAHRLETARQFARALHTDATFAYMGVTTLGFAAARFDTVICVEVLEHVPDDAAAVREFTRVLKPGGRLVVTVPGKEDLTAAEEARRYADPTPLEHVRSGYTREGLRRLLTDAGLTVTQYVAYYRWFAKVAIKAQQWLYLHHHPLLNIVTAPALTVLARLDALLPRSSWHRSHMIVAEKPRG